MQPEAANAFKGAYMVAYMVDFLGLADTHSESDLHQGPCGPVARLPG